MQHHSLLSDAWQDVSKRVRQEPHNSVLVQEPQLGAGSPTAQLRVRDKGEFGREKRLSASLLTLQLTQHIARRGYGQPVR